MAKPKYEDTFPLRAEGYAREGLTDKQIAKNLGISHETLYQYQKKHSEFSDALKRGKAPVDIEVENALLKRARGYEIEEVTVEYKPGKDGKDGEEKAKPTSIKKVKKQVLPDPTSMIFWLKNRLRKKWRDDRALMLSGDKDKPPIKIKFVEVKKK